MREKTFLTKLNKDFDKFTQAISEQKKPILCFCNYNDGVLFGDATAFAYIKGQTITTAGKYNEAKMLETILTTYEKALNNGELNKVETITEGSTKEFKKALRLASANYNAYVNPKILGAYPDGADFYLMARNRPVAVVYNGEIIKIVCPFVTYDEDFKEAE